jgi:hypothetical protein
LVIPPIALGWFGYVYLRAAVNVLLTANAPLEYVQPTAGGDLTFRVESWHLDLDANLFRGFDLTVREPDGQLLASIREFDVRHAIPLPWQPERPIVGAAAGVNLRIERLEDGQFHVARYAPEEIEEPTERAYTVDVREVEVLFIDRMAPTPWRQIAHTPRVQVDGVGDRWVASSRLTLPGIGVLDAGIRRTPEVAFAVEGIAENFDLAPILRHVAATPDADALPLLAEIRASTLIVNGPLQLYLPDEGEIQFLARGRVSTTNFWYGPDFGATVANFQGIITHQGLKGELEGQAPGISVGYMGAFSWHDDTSVAGYLRANIPNSAATPLWLRRMLPEGLRVEGAAVEGWTSFDPRVGIRLDGSLVAAAAHFQQERIAQPRATLSASGDRVAINLHQGQWQGAPLEGALAFVPETGRLHGLLQAARIPLGTVAARFGVENVEGIADLQAIIGGSTAAPHVALRLQGQAATRLDGIRYDLGAIRGAGSLTDNIFELARLTMVGPTGVITAAGHYDLQTQGLAFEVLGNALPLSAIRPELSGLAAFAGTIGGTVQEPFGRGRLEVFGAQWNDQQIPLAFTEILVDRDRIVAQELVAFRGAARIDANVALSFDDQALSGGFTARGIEIGQFTDDVATGLVAIDRGRVGGTLQNPEVEALIRGQSVVVQGVRVDQVLARAGLMDNVLRLDDLLVNLNGGQATGSAIYDLDEQLGSFQVQLDEVMLARVMPEVAAQTGLEGVVEGSLVGGIAAGQITGITATGQLQDVAVNGAFFGGGPFEISGAGDQWTGSLFLGQIERFFEVPRFTVNAATEVVDAEVVAFNVDISDLYTAAGRFIQAEDSPIPSPIRIPPTLAERLERLEGSLNANLLVSGPITDPDLNIMQAELADLRIDGIDSGTITARATRENRVWDIDQFRWLGGPTRRGEAGFIELDGRIVEGGDLALEGEIRNLDTLWLSFFEPNLARIAGRADITFQAEGPVQAPEVLASMTYAETTTVPAPPVAGLPEGVSPDVEVRETRRIDVLTRVREGRITAEGNYYLDGFTGPLTAELPFSYPFTVPTDEPLLVSLGLNRRDLDDMLDLFPWLDPARTAGVMEGQLLVRGTPANPTVEGAVSLNAPEVGIGGMDTTLEQVRADASFEQDVLNFSAFAASSGGGSVSIERGRITLDNLTETFTRSLDEILRNQMSAQISIDQFRLRQAANGGDMDAVFDGNLSISGLLNSPLVAGRVDVVEGTLAMPGEFMAGTTERAFPVNPRFDVAMSIPEPINLRAGTGNFYILGDGRLAGSLSNPDLEAVMTVERGQIRLPTARIFLEPGGVIRLTYRDYGFDRPIARADLEIEGRTSISAVGPAGVPERYEIFLEIRGDALAPDGLQLTASADPPDLSQDRILTLLGQGDLLAGGQPFRVDRQIQQALFSLAPALFDPVTEGIARSLGLDYLGVEVGAGNQLAVSASVALTRNLVLTGRRELSSPRPGQRLQYDIRLSYRPPVRSPLLQRFRLSIGSDQDRPIKFSIDYGFRF